MVTRPAFRRTLLAVCLVGAVESASRADADVKSPLSPQESLQHFQLDPGLAIELVACEPEVVDPVAIRFDEDGRLWVVEMRDYPNGPADAQQPASQIRVLTDTDGDGRYETAHVFADHLLFPTGIQPWQGGVIVTLAGEVRYLKDTDGDGRADRQETWYQGFVAENPQLRANHPRLGLDNRVTISNGLRGGSVVDPRRNDKPLSISGMDFSFDPRSFECQAVSGNGQFGLTFDDYGNRFTCNNRAPLEQVVLDNRYLARNPFLAVGAVVKDVAPAGEQSHVYPLTSAWTTSNLHAGQFTAACGVEIYRGDALPQEYRGNAFTCEPTGSLIHREVLAAEGVTFAAHTPHAGREFLATPDAWFRAVNLETGPDGALYVVDMYRAVIEHPQYMPTELQQRADLRLGDDRGRIYRIVPAGARPKRTTPKLSAASTVELVAALRHKNVWWRETAARLLLERQDPSAVKSLAQLASDAPEPTARVHALSALAGQNGLSTEVLARALDDRHARVREQAIAVSESRLQEAEALRRRVLVAANDADARVRFRAALALGGLAGEEVVAPLLAVALTLPDDSWTRHAVASALPQHMAPLLTAALVSDRVKSQPYDAPELSLVRELALIVGSRREAGEIAGLLAILTDSVSAELSPARETALEGLAQGIERRGGTLGEWVDRLPEKTSFEPRLSAMFDRVATDAANDGLAEPVRAEKIDLLKYARSRRAAEVLLPILSHSESQTLRLHATGALAPHPAAEIGPALVAAFAAQTPVVRRAIVDAMLADPARAQLLLDEIEAQRWARAELDAPRENRLREHADAAVREHARKLLATALPAERKLVLEQYQSALDLKSDPLAGKELFRKHCATCHHVGDVGVDVAPNISDSRVKTAQQLLLDILNPNQAIDNNYVSYTVVTADGTVHTGIIAAETASSVTLKQPEAKSVDLLRADIESIRSNGVSLMPEGFEKQLTRQQMADVIAFVKNWRYLDRPIPAAESPPAK